MKIAMIHTPILGRGGGERQILRLAAELQRMGNEVEIFVSALNVENSYPDMLEKLTVHVIPHPLGKKLPRWLKPQGQETASKPEETQKQNGKSWLQEYMRRNMGRQFYTIPYDLPSMINIGKNIPKGFDVINCHNYPSEWAAVAAKKRIKAPVVWMCNEPPFWFFVPELRKGLRKVNWPVYNLLDKTAVNYIDEIIVLSDIAAGYVQKAYNCNSLVVRSGVDAERFSKSSGAKIREEYGLENDFVLLQVGNIELNKRQEDAVRALKILSEATSNVKLMFDGGGRRDELVGLVGKLGLQDSVIFRRSSSDEELAEVYAACDVFIFPAQITWGLAVVEAMAAAKPVIVSDRCGASEIIQNGVNGMVVEHGSPEGIAERVKFLMSDGSVCLKLGKNAHEYVQSQLSWKKYSDQMQSIFEKTVAATQKRID